MSRRTIDSDATSAADGAASVPAAPRWKWICRLMLATYWIALFLATHLPVPKAIANEVSAFDKGIHGAAYFVLAGLLVLSNGWPYRLSLRRMAILALITISYAALDEWLQTFVARFGDVRDWASDSIGGICALLIAWMLQGLFSQRTTAD